MFFWPLVSWLGGFGIRDGKDAGLGCDEKGEGHT